MNTDNPPVPSLPNYGVPIMHPAQQKPLVKMLSRMMKPKVKAPRHKTIHTKKKKRFY